MATQTRKPAGAPGSIGGQFDGRNFTSPEGTLSLNQFEHRLGELAQTATKAIEALKDAQATYQLAAGEMLRLRARQLHPEGGTILAQQNDALEGNGLTFIGIRHPDGTVTGWEDYVDIDADSLDMYVNDTYLPGAYVLMDATEPNSWNYTPTGLYEMCI